MDKRYEQAVIVGILLLTAYAVLIAVYNNEGMGWDFVDDYLGARTLLNGYFYNAVHPFNISVSHTFSNGATLVFANNQLVTTQGIYIVFARSPLAWLFIAIAMLIDKGISIQLYIFVLLLIMAVSIFFVSKKMSLNPLILAGLMFSYFVVRWTVLYNSEELLSTGFLFLFVGLVAEKDKLSGIGAAVAGMAKLTNLILLPMLLLLSDKRKIILGIVLFAIFTLPFIAYMYLFYGYSLLAYQLSFFTNFLVMPVVNYGNGLGLLALILAYPVLILMIVLAFGLLSIGRAGLFAAIDPRSSHKYAVAYSFMLLSTIGFIVGYPHLGLPMRFGYMPYSSIALFTALVISSIGEARVFRGYNLNLVSQYALPLISFLILSALFLQVSSGNYGGWLGPAHTKNPDIVRAAQWIHNSNISSCAIVSNVWPFMNFYNITAYASDSYCNATQLRLPYMFSTAGTNSYCGYNVQWTQRPGNLNFTVELPANYICLTNK